MTQTKKYKFWIKSSRGTNKSEIVSIQFGEGELTEDEIKDELEQWCSQFGAWHVSENFMRYGYEEVSDEKKEFVKEATVSGDWNYKVIISSDWENAVYCKTEEEVDDVLGRRSFGATYEVRGNPERTDTKHEAYKWLPF